MLIQVDGKIIVNADYVDNGLTQPFNNSVLARCNPVGTLDSTFGSVAPGITVNSGLAGASGEAIALQGDGKIVAVGTATGASQSGPEIIRYTADSPISDPNQRFLTQVYLDLLQRRSIQADLLPGAAPSLQGRHAPRLWPTLRTALSTTYWKSSIFMAYC